MTETGDAAVGMRSLRASSVFVVMPHLPASLLSSGLAPPAPKRTVTCVRCNTKGHNSAGHDKWVRNYVNDHGVPPDIVDSGAASTTKKTRSRRRQHRRGRCGRFARLKA